jgi:hypothetical protein
MINDSFLRRINSKARSNQLCIAIGSRFSGSLSLPQIALDIRSRFEIDFTVTHELEWFIKWNEFIDATEKQVKRSEIIEFVRDKVAIASPEEIHRKLATIPLSNFIDISLDRRFILALREGGKNPICYEFSGGMIGSWKQSNPESPNVFSAFINLNSSSPWQGLHQQITVHPQDRIQIENMMEMVRQKDLLLLGMTPHEAEHILHIGHLAQAADKVVNTEDPSNSHQYWTKRGVYIADIHTEEVVNDLVPIDLKSYTFFDAPFPNRMLIDIGKEKQYDAFISYFTGDQNFARRISGDLANRGIQVWRDEGEIDVGDSISDKIQEGLKKCYTFIIVLSPEALGRPWVKEELRAAYNLRLAEELRILPVVYKDCELPLFLTDYRFADFREIKNYTEQIEILTRSVNNAMLRARKKR